MKKIIYSIAGASLLLSAVSCEDFLETSTPSELDTEFLLSNPGMAQLTLLKAYETYQKDGNQIHSNGLFYNYSAVGADSERNPEHPSGQERAKLSNLMLDPASFSVDFNKISWAALYDVIGICNTIINEYDNLGVGSSEEPTDLTQLWGEAVALRATAYYELVRYWGDVIYMDGIETDIDRLTPRDRILERQIAKLREVEPLMFRIGESGRATAQVMTRNYVQGLIGRCCLLAAGYTTRRTDLGTDFYKDDEGNPLTLEVKGSEDGRYKCVYARRSDWKRFLEIAKPYLEDAVNNPGGVLRLVTVDDRAQGAEGQLFGNPYQKIFQDMMDHKAGNPEIVYEIAELQGGTNNSQRPYAFGRTSLGGGSNAFPCKSYGQVRFHMPYWLEDFDNKDLRRDVTVTPTISNGKGVETLPNFQSGGNVKGGPVLNKWDENRMPNPWVKAQRKSGISNPAMRVAEQVLMLAEVYAGLGENGLAQAQLQKVRERAFASAADADVAGFVARCAARPEYTGLSGVMAAVLEEYKLEFGGEGLRREALIRNGIFPASIKALRDKLLVMMSDLSSKGYHRFDATGNELPAYIWTKLVDARAEYGYRLTTQCPADRQDDPVLFPGWRGQNDDWAAVCSSVYGGDASKYLGNIEKEKTNLAIKGLFRHIDPAGAEAAALEADGYTKVAWGAEMVEMENSDGMYARRVFEGYPDADYTAGYAPRYLIPIPVASLSANVTNGYGFKQE